MNSPSPTGRVRQNDWVLSADALQGLLAWFDDDPHRAGELYREVHAKLVRFFQWRGCLSPEDNADRAFDRVARRLAEGHDLPATGPQAYLYGVALNIWREHQREPGQTSLDENSVSLAVNPEEQLEQEAERLQKERRIGCLERCVRKLPLETRRLVIDYHCSDSKKSARKELASTLGIGLELLRTRIYRLRLGLESCVRGCLTRQLK